MAGWPGALPYLGQVRSGPRHHDVWTTRFGRRAKTTILEAMEEIECEACVRFTERLREQSYVYLLPDK